jgi:hypothetical protein
MSLWLSFLAWLFTFLRIRCNKPRLPPGTASMSPKVVRDRLERIHCTRFKHHLGPCEASITDRSKRRNFARSGSIIEGDPDEVVEHEETETWQ